MVGATRKIAEGDLSLELPITSKDEIGQLAESFNHMLVRLKQARQELEDYGRILEEKVEQRSQQLRKIQAQLMQSEKLASLGRLASGVAHEINSPLTGILTFSHLLMRKLKDNPELQRELELIVQETTRVSTIVRGLLDFARESKPQKRPCNINELILHTLSLVERQSVFQNIRIAKNLDPQVPILLVDANQIQQVFMNILLNAADAMPDGGTLTISSRLAARGLFCAGEIFGHRMRDPRGEPEQDFRPLLHHQGGQERDRVGSGGELRNHRTPSGTESKSRAKWDGAPPLPSTCPWRPRKKCRWDKKHFGVGSSELGVKAPRTEVGAARRVARTNFGAKSESEQSESRNF